MDCIEARFTTLRTIYAPKSGEPDLGVKPGNDA
jgi:hypothetical protein